MNEKLVKLLIESDMGQVITELVTEGTCEVLAMQTVEKIESEYKIKIREKR